eukprot:m.5619 g.5619  ORF g.5619 m.5619 type:complete len:113 (-) comp3341_c0_seq1:2538-2876(-)
MNWARISCSSSKMMMFVVAIILLVVQDVGAITVEQRQLQALKYHIDRPFPDLTSDWGIFNLAFSQLALNGTKNKTVVKLEPNLGQVNLTLSIGGPSKCRNRNLSITVYALAK